MVRLFLVQIIGQLAIFTSRNHNSTAETQRKNGGNDRIRKVCGFSGNHFYSRMSNFLVKCRHLESVMRCKVCQIMISYLLGGLCVGFQRRQIIADSFCLALVRKFFQQLTSYVHGCVDRSLVGTDAQEAKFGERTKDDTLASQPAKGFLV